MNTLRRMKADLSVGLLLLLVFLPGCASSLLREPPPQDGAQPPGDFP